MSFWESQTFGIILGGLITTGFTWFLDWRKSISEDKKYIRQKREELYALMYDVLMRYEKDLRISGKACMSDDTKRLFNQIQIDSIFGKQPTIDLFYDLVGSMNKNVESNPKNMKRAHELNNKECLNFYERIRDELGIK